ncbi:MAG: 16S rRNA (cytosine(967)-C(5))-methyltransferase RsmB [Clostridia bacterium]|nr:16S rRNA (cytosine(967)-C(5))-methyltransferase RsmB [Clostridia bacterium]
MANPRKTAVRALIKLEKDGGYSNIVIDTAIKNSQLDARDSGFATALFYGVLERKITLDYIISKYSSVDMDKMSLLVKQTLRSAIYQIKYMDKVPDSAAVNEAVKIIKSLKEEKAAGFVNAVLRSFLRNGKKIDYPNDEIQRMVIEYSCPRWIVEGFIKDYGVDNCKGILKGFLKSTLLSLRVNTTKITTQQLLSKFIESGIDARVSDICEDAILLSNAGNVQNLFGYDEGYFHVQDVASQLACKVLNAQPGDRVADMCSAPGGKSFTIAQYMQNKGELFAFDIYDHKVGLIKSGAERLSLDCICAKINDAGKYDSELGEFDKILCDLPCSGLGILGKKPEIRYKNVAFLDSLQDLQYDLLCTSAKYLKPQGTLVYSTCSLRNEENRKVAERFLQNHKDFEAVSILPHVKRGIDEPDNMLTLMPHIHKTDGFFISAFVKKG